jgi:hypothetical protein
VKHADTRIETENGSGQPGFRFEKSIKVVEYRVRRIHREARRPRQRRNPSAENSPMIG